MDARAVFITYNGLLDPLGPSQILPYVECIHHEWPMHVISFERRERMRYGSLRATEDRLRAQGIGWTRLGYHRRFSVLAKTFDVIAGVNAVHRALTREAIEVVHVRGYLPMEIAYWSAGKLPIIFDMRGLQGEEYTDGRVWTRHDPRYWLLKRSEERFFRRADAAVVLTHAILPYVRQRFASVGRTPPVEVIPTCVDLDRFTFRQDQRRASRADLGVSDATVVFAYSGSLGTWYMADEMARFVRAFGDLTGREVFLFWQVNTGQDLARAASERAGLRPDRIRISQAKAAEVAPQLCGADAGLALIRPTFSKRASCPTKYAEYLALGLPVVFSAGVGDSEELARRRVGVDVTSFDDAGLRRAALSLSDLLATPRGVFRSTAAELFDLQTVAAPAYRELYKKLLA